MPAMSNRLEGEGFLYDGEKGKWPDPQKWNQEQINVWMVCGARIGLVLLKDGNWQGSISNTLLGGLILQKK